MPCGSAVIVHIQIGGVAIHEGRMRSNWLLQGTGRWNAKTLPSESDREIDDNIRRLESRAGRKRRRAAEIPSIERYEIGFYGTESPGQGSAIYRRLSSDGDAAEGDIFIPDFQRGYIWSKKQADGFIESLLLRSAQCLRIFLLSTDRVTQRRLVIDGGQRLRTIKSFIDGSFKGSANARLQAR